MEALKIIRGTCNKAFSQPSNFSRHKLIHSVLKYQCNVCNKAFTQAISFQTHKLIYSGNTKYCSDVCFKSFTDKWFFKA